MPLPYTLKLAQRFFHGFQPHPDRWFRLRLSLFKRGKMRIVAVGTIVTHRFFLPAVDTLAMRTEIPVFLSLGMTLPTNPPGFVETNLTVAFGMQRITILIIMTGQTPETILSVVEADSMHRGEFVRYWIGLPIFMALGPGIEDKFLLAWRYLWG